MRLYVASVVIATNFFSTTVFATNVPAKSFFPKIGLAKFIVENLDIATFRSSLGPKRSAGQTKFKDLGMSPSKISEQGADFITTDWDFQIKILKKGDENRDGLQDVLVCVTEKAKQASYNTSDPYLLTRYSDATPVVALAFEIDTPDCPKFAK